MGDSPDRRFRIPLRGCLFGGAALAVVALVTLLFWPVTDLIADHDVGDLPAAERAKELRTARDAARGRILQVVVGLLAVAGFGYTVRNFRLAREQSELNRRTLEQSEAVQVADRFARSIDQLAAEAVDIRLGGIYSLERIMRDSPRDQPPVVDVLTAFVRRSSRQRDAEVPQDLQAAMTVLARRDTGADLGRLNLRDARLAGVETPDAALARADLSGADLSGADFARADLTGADLTGARIDRAALGRARLRDAVLTAATARDARLADADLHGADLTGADLADADLTSAGLGEVKAHRAILRGAVLRDADLADAELAGADLAGADLAGAALGRAELTKAVLSGVKAPDATLCGAELRNALLSTADLQGADLTDAVVAGANLSGCELTDAVLDGVDLREVSLAGLDLSDALASPETRLPAGWIRDPESRRIARR